MSNIENLKNVLAQFNQQHVFQFWNDLNEDQRDHLALDLQELNVSEVTSYFKRAVDTITQDQEKLDDRLKPIPSTSYGAVIRSSPEDLKKYEDKGLEQIADGAVGVLLMAGGQGTRLGVTSPKGMYDVGLPSHKTLYQLQAERIKKLEDLAHDRTGKRNNITWYIMTSEATMQPTKEFFASHNYFGLSSENIVMFEQGLLPCFTFDGKIIMENKHKIAKSPDGNGGLYRALRDRNILNDIERRGIKHLHAHSVDNILVKVADPVFIGYCMNKGADCGAKVVEKAFPTEAVGVVCEVDGKYQVVEYSEITSSTAERRNEDGRLTFSAGNICNHYFTTEFLRRIADRHENCLTLHVAKKKIPFVDENGKRQTPEKPNGIKMEKFVFDVFQFANKFVTWEVQRDIEFSALKNADTAVKDTPTTARNDIFLLHRRYIENAGGSLPESKNGPLVCEISPLLSYAGEGLEHIVANRKFGSTILLQASNERHPTSNGNSNNTH